MRRFLLAVVLCMAVAPLASAQTQPGVYQPNAHTLFYLPLDAPDAGAPEGCSINNPGLLSYIPDRFGTVGKAIHVSARGSASDYFFIQCNNSKIASSTSANFTVGYSIRTTVQQLGDCSFTGVCSMRNLTILASNSDNSGCRKYLTIELDAGPSVGAYPIACSSSSSNPPLRSTISISDGQWHSLIWVFDYTNKILTFYLDGVQNNQGSLPDTPFSAANFQAVAGAENGSFALNGEMDDLWVEDHAWTPAEVAQFFGAVIGVTGLSAIVGKGSVYLLWHPSPLRVDRYLLEVDKKCLPGVMCSPFVPPGVRSIPFVPKDVLGVGGVTQQNSLLLTQEPQLDSSGLPTPLQDGATYSFRLIAEKAGVPSTPSNWVTADPNGFPGLPPKPEHPVLFLHGFMGDGDKGGTFEDTLHFMEDTLGWTYGGQLYHQGKDLTTIGIDRTGQCERLLDTGDIDIYFFGHTSVDPAGNFFTASFGNNLANYDTVPDGLVHQGEEVSHFVAKMVADKVPPPFILVGHSNGGLAARSFITYATRFADPRETVSQLVTYGTPHRGADLPDEVLGAFLSDGARDAQFFCDPPSTPGGIIRYPAIFLDDLNARPLSDDIKYVAIIGQSRENDFPLPDGDRNFDCHAATWDGLVPTTSANLKLAPVTSQLTKPIQTFLTNRTHKGQGNDFPTILCALNSSCAQVRVMSPVDIEVTAPDGRAMARDLSAIPGASYMTIEDQPGHETATVLIPFPLGGQYQIKVIPKPGASPNDTFTINLTQNDTTTVFAQDMRVQDIPASGFPVHVNSQPVASAGPDQIVECSSHTGTPVTLNGSASTDSDGDTLTYKWADENGNIVGTTALVNSVLVPLGTHVFTLTVTDPAGFSSTATTHVTVRDTTAPVLTASLSRNVLWPPKHNLVPITANIQASDACDPNPTVVLVSITSNEPDNGLDDGDTPNDIQGAAFGTDDRSFFLRAERSGTGTGRIYTVRYRARDVSGNVSFATAQVSVPYNQQ